MRPAGAGTAIVALLVLTGTAAAQPTEDEIRLDLGGYARSISGFSDLGVDLPDADRRAAFNGGVVRFKWLLELGDQVRVSVHNRFQTQLSSSTTLEGGTAGFGVTRVPSRSVNLSSSLITEPHFSAWHDIDRLSVSVYTGVADITVGRQAITWGISTIFPVADMWAQFSPFELDTEEKPGVDAVRALSYPADGLELDLVIADRGDRRLVSAGIRATKETASADLYAAAAKSWRELLGLGGATVVAGAWRMRAEIAVPWDLDQDRITSPRFTLGADRIGSEWQWSFEYHHNGLGTTDPTQYGDRLTSLAFARGQSYYLGRHLLGASAGHQFTDRFTTALTALVNLQDPSTVLIPALNYDAGQNLRFSFGALLSGGERPVVVPGIPIAVLQSEFGTYGNTLFATGSLYF